MLQLGCVKSHACCEESVGFMGRPWARSDPGCAKQRARFAHYLLLRLQPMVEACAHDTGDARETATPRDQ